MNDQPTRIFYGCIEHGTIWDSYEQAASHPEISADWPIIEMVLKDESDARAETMASQATRIAELEAEFATLTAERQETRTLRSMWITADDEVQRLRAANVKLREALAFYSNPSDYVSPLTGGQGKLYYDCGGTAKRALAGKEPVRTENGPPCPECGYDGPSKWSQGLWRCPECWASMETGKEGAP